MKLCGITSKKLWIPSLYNFFPVFFSSYFLGFTHTPITLFMVFPPVQNQALHHTKQEVR